MNDVLSILLNEEELKVVNKLKRKDLPTDVKRMLINMYVNLVTYNEEHSVELCIDAIEEYIN